MPISSDAAAGKKIKKQKLKCPGCGGTEFTCDGWYYGKHEKRQRHMCSNATCKRRFRDNPGFEYRQVPKTLITLALLLYGTGSVPASIHLVFKHQGVEVHKDTITRILEHYSGMVEKKIKPVKPPCVGDKWGCDEKHQKVRGEDRWIVYIMDLATRFILAWDMSDTKEKYDAVPLLRAAKDMAGKVPRPFITDGLKQYHIAFKKVFRTIRGIRSTHIRDIHIRNVSCNTNLQERLNGWFASRCKCARGINKEESLTFRMAILHYRSIKPHGGMNRMTPATAAGIEIEGDDAWLTPIQYAASTT